MRRVTILAVLVVVAVLPIQARADENYAVTPSGAAEALFEGTPEATSGVLSNQCINLSWTVISSSPTTVTCEAPMSFGQSLAGSLLMGNRYSTPPRQFYRFNIAEYQGHSRVQASGWMELQMAFGQMRRTDYSGPPFHNSAMNLLVSSGGQFPPHTIFPNHAYVGVQFEATEIPERGAKITNVELESAGEAAGLQVGDVVLRIAGKRAKDAGDIMDGLAKATKSATFPIEVYRQGDKLTLEVETRFRPEIGPPNWPEHDAVASDAKGEMAGPRSIADELAKFAKLRDDGIITEEEFQDQKDRLLSTP